MVTRPVVKVAAALKAIVLVVPANVKLPVGVVHVPDVLVMFAVRVTVAAPAFTVPVAWFRSPIV